MATRRVSNDETPKTRLRPARTPEARENQLIAMAYDLAAKQLAEGSASSQVVSQLLKLGSSREKLEQERLAKENELLQAKAEAMASAVRVEELYGKALDAMRSYSGQTPMELEIDLDD